MIEFLIEVVGEFVLQFLLEVLAEFGYRSVTEPFRSTPHPVLAGIGYAMFGAAVGGLSLLAFPHHLTPSGMARVLNLVLTPLACGACMAVLGAWRRKHGQALVRLDRFSYGFLFAFAIAITRYHFAD
ncbi:MAG: hypothetical protein JNL30_18600 [Rubrivivax sp.]|nr:hypothetical protein [Rubrivivax sp.]